MMLQRWKKGITHSEITHKLKKRDRKKRVIFFLFFLLFFLGSTYFFFYYSKPVNSPEVHSVNELKHHVIEGSIDEDGSLYQSLVKNNIPFNWIDLIISQLATFLDFKKLRGGTYRMITDTDGALVKFVFEKSPIEVYKIEKGEKGYIARQKEILLNRYLVKISGKIRSSLYEAMNASGEQDVLALHFAEILAWEIDFYQEVREGDQFQLLVEKLYKGNQFVQYGTIHAVEYQRGNRKIRGFRFGDDYYNEQGHSLRKPFLKAPLRFDRISSRFSYARKHPILGGTRPHLGIDYAAPTGTPVWAVADGTVISVGWAGGFGKQVVIRHQNGYQTYYGHLSRYGPGIRSGVKVRQKQIIGYVGATGMATGPHLDYRLSKDGKFMNPLKTVFPSGVPLKGKDLNEFYPKREEWLFWLTHDTIQQIKLEDVRFPGLQFFSEK